MVDFDKIVDFVNNVFGSNEGLAKITLLEMGIDPETRRPVDAYPVDACYCCRDGGCQSGCRCFEFVGDAD